MPHMIQAAESIDFQIKMKGFYGFSLPFKLSSLKQLHKDYGNQIFHVSAKYNYFYLTKCLITYGVGDCTVKNLAGMTPLMIAITNENYEVARILHHEQMRRMKFQSFIVALLEKSKTSRKISKNLRNHLVQDFIHPLKNKKMSSEIIGKVLAQATEFDLYDVVYLQNPAITEGFIQSVSFQDFDRFNNLESDMIFETVGTDLEHILVILQNRPHRTWSGPFCAYIVKNICRFCESTSGKEFLKGIFSSEIVINRDTIWALEKELKRADKKNVEAFLTSNFHLIIKANLDYDVLACFFGRCDDEVFSCLKDEYIDVNGRGFEGKTPLHFAAETNSIEKVQMLLDRGADPNAIDCKRRTPLSLAVIQADYHNCVELLLLSGVSLKVLTTCPIKHDHLRTFIITKQLLIAQVILYEALGKKKTQIQLLLKVLAYDVSDKVIRECRTQLREFKINKIRETDLSIFTILTGNLNVIARYIKREDLQKISTFIVCNEETLIPFYQKLLKKRVSDIMQIQSFKDDAMQMISKFIGVSDSNHLVVLKIIEYLDVYDMKKVSLMESTTEIQNISVKPKTRSFFQTIQTVCKKNLIL